MGVFGNILLPYIVFLAFIYNIQLAAMHWSFFSGEKKKISNKSQINIH